MTEDELLSRLQELSGNGDPESSHQMGDAVLIEALRHFGWNRLADEWQKQSKGWWQR